VLIQLWYECFKGIVRRYWVPGDIQQSDCKKVRLPDVDPFLPGPSYVS
jgi:hypothetical protein